MAGACEQRMVWMEELAAAAPLPAPAPARHTVRTRAPDSSLITRVCSSKGKRCRLNLHWKSPWPMTRHMTRQTHSFFAGVGVAGKVCSTASRTKKSASHLPSSTLLAKRSMGVKQ